jgi:hypothetical protein
MAWPSANVSLANVDSGSDSISSARADIYDAFTKLNAIIGEGPAIEAVAVSGQDTVVYSGANGTLTLVAGTNITLTTDNTAKSVTIASTASGGDLVNDTTPQLGGDLDTNDYRILNAPVNAADRHVINIGVLDGKTNQVNIDQGLLLMEGGSGSSSGYMSLYYNGLATISAYNTSTSSPVDVGIERLSLPSQLTGTPANTTTPTGYIQISIGGVTRYMPYYT